MTRTLPKAALALGGVGAILFRMGLVALLWRFSALAPTGRGWFAYATGG